MDTFDQKGFSLAEAVVAVAAISIISMGAVTATQALLKWRSTMESSNSVYSMMLSISKSLQSNTAWSNTISNPANGSMKCLVDQTPCNPAGGEFAVVDDGNHVLYDSRLTGTKGLAAGFTRTGHGVGGLCDSFDETNGNDSCPFHYKVSWTPICPASGDCINPPVHVSAIFSHRVPANSEEIRMNPENYNLDVTMGGFTPQPPILVGTMLYTNVDQAVTANVMSQSFAGKGGALTVASVGPANHGTVVTNKDGTITYTPSSGYHGIDSFRVSAKAAKGGAGSMSVYVKTMTKFTWTGDGGDANWSTAGNWCGLVVNNACSNVTDIPNISGTAIFDTSCTANCNSMVDLDIDAKGIEMDKGFTATIKQGAGKKITLHSAGYIQQDGVFIGSDAPILLGESDFDLTGGKFISTQSELNVQGSFAVHGSGDFQPNDGTVTISWLKGWPPLDHKIIAGDVTYNNFYFKPNARVDLSGGILKVAGKLTLGANVYADMNNGTIKASGDVEIYGSSGGYGSMVLQIVGSPAGQTISGMDGGAGFISNLIFAAGPNDVRLKGVIAMNAPYLSEGIFKYESGNIVADPASTVVFHNLTGWSITPGPADYANVRFDGGRSWSTMNLNGGTMKVRGVLELAAGQSSGGCVGNLGNGTIEAHGDVKITDCGMLGSAIIKVAGSSAGQTVFGSAGAAVSNLRIEAGANRVALDGKVGIADSIGGVVGGGNANASFAFISASPFVATGSELIFWGGHQSATLIPGTVEYADVTFSTAGNTNVDMGSGSMIIKGKLTLDHACFYSCAGVKNGKLLAFGDVHITNRDGVGGRLTSAKVVMSGAPGGQTITSDAGAGLANLVIDSGSSAVTLAGDLTVAGQWDVPGNFTYTSGTFNQSGATLSFGTENLTTVTPGAISYDKVKFIVTHIYGHLAVVGNLKVAGNFEYIDATDWGFFDSGVVEAMQDATFTVNHVVQGSGKFKLSASGSDRSLSVSSTLQMYGIDFEVATGGNVVNLLGGDMTAQNLTVTNGKLDLKGNAATISGNLTLASGTSIAKSGGRLSVGGATIAAGSYSSGMVVAALNQAAKSQLICSRD